MSIHTETKEQLIELKKYFDIHCPLYSSMVSKWIDSLDGTFTIIELAKKKEVKSDWKPNH